LQILADGLDNALLRLGLEHGVSNAHFGLDAVDVRPEFDLKFIGANGMDSTELMRELNASIDILLDSENYLLSLNEYMNEASAFICMAACPVLLIIGLQELHRVCTIEAAVTGRLGDLLYEREEARRAKEDAESQSAAEAGGDAASGSQSLSPDLKALEMSLKQACFRPFAALQLAI
jgi:hypothetical protein